MKVLEKGNGVRKYRCPDCYSLLEYGYEDMHKRKENTITYEYIICPICKKEILIRSKMEN